MLALSTSCKSSKLPNGKTLLRLLENFDITGLELYYSINEALYRQIRGALKQSRRLTPEEYAPPQ